MSQQPSRIQTRAKNSTEHPGAIVKKRTRRTKQQMADFRAETAAKKQAVDDEKKAKVQKVAALESQIANANNDMDVMPRATRPRPSARPLRRTETYIGMTTSADKQVTLQVNENSENNANASDLDDTGITIESSEARLSDTDFDEDTTRAKKKQKKESKPKLRDAVNEVRKDMITAGHGQVSTNLNPVEGDKAPRDGKIQGITGMATCVFCCCCDSWLQLQC
jgi:hypothetical protein